MSGLAHVNGLRVICTEHDLDWEASSAEHAGNFLVQHLREKHRPPLTEVDLTSAAAWVLALRSDDVIGDLTYRGALGCWAMLLGLESDDAALEIAEQLAGRPSPVLATVPPF